jgi:hypothetical protein
LTKQSRTESVRNARTAKSPAAGRNAGADANYEFANEFTGHKSLGANTAYGNSPRNQGFRIGQPAAGLRGKGSR